MFDGIDLGPSTEDTRAQAAARFPGYALGLARRRPMERTKPMARSPMRKSRPKPIPAKVAADVRERAQDCCEFPGCGRYLGPDGGEKHHAIKRSQGGKHTAGNLWLLCPNHHEWAESHPKDAVRVGLSIQKGKVA